MSKAKTIEQEIIKNFKLPKGSLIIYNTYGIHRAAPVFKNNFTRKSVFFQVDSEIENSEPIILNTKFITEMNNKISIIIPCYNSSNTIQKPIDCIKASIKF